MCDMSDSKMWRRMETARRLRDWETLQPKMRESPICAFLDALGTDGYEDWQSVCAELADMIDPTCDIDIPDLYEGDVF